MSDKSKIKLEASPASLSAISRLKALKLQEEIAAKSITEPDSYSDFFVEGSGDPWHEAFSDVITGNDIKTQFSSSRMRYIDRLANDDYCDFFVENTPDGPWHEKCEDMRAVELLRNNTLKNRMKALQTVNVIKAFSKISK